MLVLKETMFVSLSVHCPEIICVREGWSVGGGGMDTYRVPPADVFLALSHLFLTQPYETRVIILICR